MSPARRRTLAALALLIGAVCTGLGAWQIDRLGERRAEVAERRARLAEAPVRLGDGGADVPGSGVPLPPAESLAWRRAVAVGRFAFGREAVLAPRSWSGSPAVFLLTPLMLDEATALPVLRGAVPAPDGFHAPIEQARPVPEGDDDVSPDTVRGTLLPVPDRTDGAASEPDTLQAGVGVYPVFAELDPARMEPHFEGRIPGVYLHLDSTTVDVPAGPGPALPIRIPPPELDDGPHLSYAIQWFSFAAIALIGGGIVFFGGGRGG